MGSQSEKQSPASLLLRTERNFPQAGELMSCRCDLEAPPLRAGASRGRTGRAGGLEKLFLLFFLICESPYEGQ